ncbi:MAG: copper resistance protein CopC, partial [Chloroflexota bacterium]|nr:copper resistance protein CopC [Chloroflexota bacterium]
MPTTTGRRAAAAAEHMHARGRTTLFAVTLCLLVALGLSAPHSAAAHPELVRANPPPDGLLAAPPQRLDLWVSEAVDAGAGSPSLRLLNEAGQALPVRDIVLDPADPTHIRADVAGLGTGTYTVSWSARSATDGHTLSGTYAFRVGGGRAPGAATVQGEAPQPWGVATRWLTFLGTAVAGGGFLFARILLGGDDPGDL